MITTESESSPPDTAIDRLYWPVELRERVDRIAARNGITRGEQIVRMIAWAVEAEETRRVINVAQTGRI